MKFFTLIILLLIGISLSLMDKSLINRPLLKATNMKGPNKKLYNFSSKPIDGDSGSIYSLTNHKISCPPGSAVSGFHLFTNFGIISNDNAYEWNCLPQESITLNSKETSVWRTGTTDIDSPRDDLEKLFDIPVICPMDTVIQDFQLLRPQNQNKIYYRYTCAKANILSCKMKISEYKDANWGKIFSKSVTMLEDLSIGNYKNEVLTYFSMLFDFKASKMAYAAKTCLLGPLVENKEIVKPKPPILSDPISTISKTDNTDPRKFSDGIDSENPLLGINMSCEQGEYLQGFSFYRNKSIISATYMCAKGAITKEDIFNGKILLSKTNDSLTCPPFKFLTSIIIEKSESHNNAVIINYTCSKFQIEDENVFTFPSPIQEINFNEYVSTLKVISSCDYGISQIVINGLLEDKDTKENDCGKFQTTISIQKIKKSKRKLNKKKIR